MSSRIQLVEFRELKIHSGILRGSGITSQNKARYTILLCKCFSLTFNHSVRLTVTKVDEVFWKHTIFTCFSPGHKKIYLGIHYLWILKVAFVRAFPVNSWHFVYLKYKRDGKLKNQQLPPYLNANNPSMLHWSFPLANNVSNKHFLWCFEGGNMQVLYRLRLV